MTTKSKSRKALTAREGYEPVDVRSPRFAEFLLEKLAEYQAQEAKLRELIEVAQDMLKSFLPPGESAAEALQFVAPPTRLLQ
jgi:hypothetical protein